MKKDVQKIFTDLNKRSAKSPYFKVLTAVYLFDFLDRIREKKFPKNWLSGLKQETKRLTDMFSVINQSFDFSLNNFDGLNDAEKIEEFARKTGEVYYKLWKDFKKEEYFAQTKKNLKERLEKNKISVKGIGNSLDDGCGGGRYTLALKSLGVKKIVGLDVSQNSIDFAKKMSPFPKSQVDFVQGSVLKLPFKDKSFDFVFSNGVLHHTESTEKGLSEIYRVLKSGGKCWLYLYGGKESLFWDIVDFCRELLKDVPQHYTQTVMETLGYPPGRVFHRCDFFYVPVNRRYFESEVIAMLKKAGFSTWRRLNRGAPIDWDEMMHNNPKIDTYIYGEGEMRFLIEK